MATKDSNASAGEGFRVNINHEFIMDAVQKSADVLLAYAANGVLIMERTPGSPGIEILGLSPESKPGVFAESMVIGVNDLTPHEAVELTNLLVRLQQRRYQVAMLEKNLNNMDG